MQQAIFTPVGLTVLDVTTKGKVSVKEILKQPLHQPLLIGSLLRHRWSRRFPLKIGWFPVPNFIFDPIDMIGDSAVPMILMAFGMSLHGTKPLQQKGDRPAIFTVAVLKNIVMPIIAFLLAYFVMGFRGADAVRLRGTRRSADRPERLQLRGPLQRGSHRSRATAF